MSGSDNFIELGRTFSTVSQNSDQGDAQGLGFTGERLTWPELLERPRVVILSEAGAGKTEEIRHQARRLREHGAAAFFIRLEHVADEFESAFEEGNFEGFESWVAGVEEGWLLLDSVDEARLSGPQDFEKAIRRVARRLAPALNRAHVVITSRPYAWRAKTDLRLCEQLLPFAPSQEVAPQQPEPQPDGLAVTRQAQEALEGAFTIVALNDLDATQVKVFVDVRAPGDARAFSHAVQRADAWSFTTRPQDLNDLLEFWSENQRIGSRLELMQTSVRRRLNERNVNHAEARPLTSERAKVGSQLMAAASVLTRIPAIRVPGSEGSASIHVDAVLPDWSATDQATLLARPIFDEAIYGTVRFYHRSVREYLCAEWFANLLRRQTSRPMIERVLFREQYGLEVVVPETRAILPWLVLFDDRICDRVMKLAPKIFFEGGDPSALPLVVRRKILYDVVDHIAVAPVPSRLIENEGIERFASLDLADDVKKLLVEKRSNDQILWFLLRVVWQGRLKDALPESKLIALDAGTERLARIAAFRAVSAAGTVSDMAEIRDVFLTQSKILDRIWLNELVSDLEPGFNELKWLFTALAKVAPVDQHRTDGLDRTLEDLFDRLSEELHSSYIDGLANLLQQPPVVERRHCEISKQFAWLLRPAASAAARLIELRSLDALRSSTLHILRMVPSASDFDTGHVGELKTRLADLVPSWPELNWAFLWHLVAKERSWLDKSKNERLTNARFVSVWPNFIRFKGDDFEQALEFCSTKPLLDDKLIAISIAFDAYVLNGRQPSMRRRLKRAAALHPDLAERLSWLMRPVPSADIRRLKKSNAAWSRRIRQRESSNSKTAENNKKFIEDNLEQEVILPGLDPSTGMTSAQLYLLEKARQNHDKSDSKFSQNNWRNLISEFGERVATGYRESATKFWRRAKPKLISEGAPENSTPYSVVFGLVGIAIESSEIDGWTSTLTVSEVESALRHAMHEMNGFPVWLPQLYNCFPDLVCDFLMEGVKFELSHGVADRDMNYVLSDISWGGQWLWDSAAPHMVKLLERTEPASLSVLRKILIVLQGSSLPDDVLDALASHKARDVQHLDNAATWFAVWAGVNPDAAVPAVRQRITQIHEREVAVRFVMVFITQLVGSRFNRPSARDAYHTAASLKSLYLLARTYMPEDDDKDRRSWGVNSIDLRDEAEEARSTLFSKLREMPGKAAFTALMELSAEHPDPSYRSWALRHAQHRAEADSNGDPWSAYQVREFNDKLERTPSNHRELFDLAVMRLEDLQHDLEDGDASEAEVLMRVNEETELRNVLGSRLRLTSHQRYSVVQEEEYADSKRVDLRIHAAAVDAPVPVELKLSHKWTASQLFERLENQLCGDYLRDVRSGRGIFLIVHQGKKSHWILDNNSRTDFAGLIRALVSQWLLISNRFPGVDEIKVIGIDLTKRTGRRRLAHKSSTSLQVEDGG